jgi:hypothetical protein
LENPSPDPDADPYGPPSSFLPFEELSSLYPEHKVKQIA